MRNFKSKILILSLSLLFIGLYFLDMGKKNSLKIVEITTYNKEYKEKMLSTSQSTQETPWGFQEISLKNQSKHYITSIKEYQNLIKLQSNQKIWKDNKVHIIYFSKGMYEIPIGKTYFVLTVPSQTIIEGEGMGKTIFKAVHEIDKNDKFQFRRLFNLEYAKYDVVVRGISFYNETKDNKWGLFYANGSINRENYLFENIEFDDTFGAIGKRNYNSNFITFRGLKKRIGKTTERINKFFTVPIPLNYQFHTQNSDNIELAGQIGVRKGNSVVFHDCELGDNISATIDIYSNYVEIVGVKFINPLHDHAIKNPQGNHLYIHDSSFELRYEKKIIEGTGYWSPTFFTHEITAESTISLRKNYHFKNVTFKRVFQTILGIRNGIETAYVESEPFTIYDENEKRINNISGDMIWEDIFFEGYSAEHEIVGYPNVQTAEGYKALNYTNHIAQSAQMKAGNNNSHGSYEVAIAEQQNTSKEDVTGVYSWGNRQDGTIDYPRDNRLFIGTKLEATSKPYIQMYSSSMKESYNSKLKI